MWGWKRTRFFLVIIYLILGLSTNEICVSSITSHMFDKLVGFSNYYMMCNKWFAVGVWMYLLKSLSLLQNTSHTMSIYLHIVDVPTSNLFHICFALNSWVNLYNTIVTIFLTFNYGLIGLRDLNFKNGVNSSTKTLKASNVI